MGSKYNMQMFPQDKKELENEEDITTVEPDDKNIKIINGIKCVKEALKLPELADMNDFIMTLYNKYGKKFIIRINGEIKIIEFTLDRNFHPNSCKFKNFFTRKTEELFFITNYKLHGIHVTLNQTKKSGVVIYKEGILINGGDK